MFLQNTFNIIMNDYELIESDIYNIDFKITNLDFSYPSKSIYWVLYDNETKNISNNEDISFEIFINNEKIGINLDNIYYNVVDKWKTHQTIFNYNIYSYTFSLNPHKYQPSGYLDFKSMKSKYITTIMKSKIMDPNMSLQIYSLSSRLIQFSNGFCVGLS
jgi:hypothetical protein